MEGQKIQAKLTRTNSSLLRSSPTVRSIQSLSSVSEVEETGDLEEQKPHSKPCTPPVRSNAAPVLAVLFLSGYTVFAFLNWDEMSPSENLLLSLIFVAVLLFFVSKNKGPITRNFVSCKELCDGYCKRLGFLCFASKNHSKPVEWFIGEPDSTKIEVREQDVKFTTEGVEFYSNGDFYEGEFHKGRCNGSGVYNFIVNGRYEGDWIDGRYDGYGIESWARGSRYKGQYRQGTRHGYGVYKFYTGDSYSGEWCNGQSHGIGVQTCGDGSCFLGEFKCGVKHGLGCYHFRYGFDVHYFYSFFLN